MRVVVTGAAGFIGTNLCLSLASGNHAVMAVDDLSHGVNSFSDDIKNIEFRKSDISKADMLSVFRDFKADSVCHLADASVASPSWETKMFGRYTDALVNVLEASVAAHVKKFVYASSSDYLFGRQCKIPVKDSMQSRPASLYGVHKYNCERIITHYASVHKFRWVVLRFPYVYGPSMRHCSKKIRKGYCFIAEALHRPSVRVPGDGNQTRDFLWVGDAVSAAEIALSDKLLIGSVNVGTGVETSINKVLERIQELRAASKRKLAKIEYTYKRKDDVLRSSVDASTLKEHRWIPKVGIAHGLTNLLNNGIELNLDH